MRRLVAAVVAWLRFDVPSCCPHPDLIPDPRPSVARDERGKSIPPRARCPYCKRREAVAVNGRLYRHPTNDGAECEGSYQYPVDAPTRSEAVAS